MELDNDIMTDEKLVGGTGGCGRWCDCTSVAARVILEPAGDLTYIMRNQKSKVSLRTDRSW